MHASWNLQENFKIKCCQIDFAEHSKTIRHCLVNFYICMNCIWSSVDCTHLNMGTKVNGERNTHAHTHPFNDPFSVTTQLSRYQKGKTNLDFTRDSEWQWHQLRRMQVCTSLQTDKLRQPHQHPHSVFYRPDALPAAQPTASKHWRQINRERTCAENYK